MFLLYLWDGGWQAAMYWPIAASGNKKAKEYKRMGKKKEREKKNLFWHCY